MNHESREPVWIGEGRSIATLEKFFDQLGPEGCQRLQLVTLDMSNAYIEEVRRLDLPCCSAFPLPLPQVA